MRIGYDETFTGGNADDGEYVVRTARLVEELGFDSLWVGEHIVWSSKNLESYPNGPMGLRTVSSISGVMDPFQVLSAAAVATTRIRLGTGIALVPLRNPVLMARQVTTLDRLSGGRFDFGVGIGWWREEYAGLGVPWERRGARFDDHLAAMTALWTDELSSHSGEFVSFEELIAQPKPAQQPHPPIYFGGHGPATIKRIVATVNSGWYASNRSLEELASFRDALHDALISAGRSTKETPLKVALTTHSDVESDWSEVAAYIKACEELGIDEVVCRPRFTDRASVPELLPRFATALGLS